MAAWLMSAGKASNAKIPLMMPTLSGGITLPANTGNIRNASRTRLNSSALTFIIVVPSFLKRVAAAHNHRIASPAVAMLGGAYRAGKTRGKGLEMPHAASERSG